MAIIGPGAISEVVAQPGSTLDGASEYEYVTIKNPLPDDFAIRVAQDIPVNMPFEIRDKTSMVQDEGDVTRNYGLGLKNPDFQGRKHISNVTVIPAGGTINLKGSEAQVAVRQLVNEILQRDKKTARLLSDPELRRKVEGDIIQKRGNIQELMDENLRSTRNQLDEALNKSNEVIPNEPTTTETAFPDLAAPTKRGPGRPKQTA